VADDPGQDLSDDNPPVSDYTPPVSDDTPAVSDYTPDDGEPIDTPRSRPSRSGSSAGSSLPPITIPSADFAGQSEAIAAEREVARQRLVAQGQHSQRLLEDQQRETESLRADIDAARTTFEQELAAAHAERDKLAQELQAATDQARKLDEQISHERVENERLLTTELADQQEQFQRRLTSQAATFEAHVETLHTELDGLRTNSAQLEPLKAELEQATARSDELSTKLTTQTDDFDTELERKLAEQTERLEQDRKQALAEQASIHRTEIDTLKAASEAELSAAVARARDEEKQRVQTESEQRADQQAADIAAAVELEVKQKTLAIELRTQAAELRAERVAKQLQNVQAEHSDQVDAVARVQAEVDRRLEDALEAQALHLQAEHRDLLKKREAELRSESTTALEQRSTQLEELFALELARQADELTQTSSARLSEQAANFEKVLTAELKAQSDQHESQLSTHAAFSREITASTFDGTVSEPVTRSRLQDLTGQITYLRSEVRRYRQILERDRIEHTQQLLAAQEAADATYGKAQLEFSTELQRYSTVNANALISQQVDFDQALAQREEDHDLALERMHENYLEKIRESQAHAQHQLATAKQRFEHEIADLKAANRHASTRRQRMAAQDRSDHDDDLEQVRAEAAQLKTDHAALNREHLLLSQRFEQLQHERDRQDETLAADLERARQALADERTKIAAERTEWLRKSAVLAAQADDMRRAQQVQLAAERADMQARLDEASTRFRTAMAGAEERLLIAAAREADLEARVNRSLRATPPTR